MTDFYKRLDDATRIGPGVRKLLEERPENLHDYQGCAKDAAESLPAAPEQKDCGCTGEFHNQGCKCTCTDHRKDALCLMHHAPVALVEARDKQKALEKEQRVMLSERLKGRPAVAPEEWGTPCFPSTQCPECNWTTGYGHHASCSSSEPVAPVEANEKEPDWAKLDYASKEHGCPCDKCAEPKPTPSAPAMNMVEIVRPTAQECFDKAIELIHKLRPAGCFGDEEGNYSSLEFYVYALKPQPDSSSIPDPLEATERLIERYQEALANPNTSEIESKALRVNMKTLQNTAERFRDSSSIRTEPTFEDVLRNRAGAYQNMGREHRKNEEYAAACCCEDKASGLYVAIKLYRSWNAAKGQSNGR